MKPRRKKKSKNNNLFREKFASNTTSIEIIEIQELGVKAEGKAIRSNGDICYIPNALPKETVQAQFSSTSAIITKIIKKSHNRVEPFCSHFPRCGGCSAQHISKNHYTQWKIGIIEKAMKTRGLKTTVKDLIDAHGAGRRRVTFHGNKNKTGISAGFMSAKTNDILNIDNCPVLSPDLETAINVSRDIIRMMQINHKSLDILLTQTATGIDCNIDGIQNSGQQFFSEISEITYKYDLARVTVGRETVIETRSPIIFAGDSKIVLPPKSFLQPTKSGEEILVDLVLKNTQEASHVLDLYCGIGPFTLAIAKKTPVYSFDNDAMAINALTKAANNTSGLKPIKAERRNLKVNPLVPYELDMFDIIVLDPPRQGAFEQIKQILLSKVTNIIYVSCNPISFARDASILIEGGFNLEPINPIDQFKFTSHVELLALFQR